MHYREWKEIFNGINFQGLSHENVIDRIKSTLNRKRPSTYIANSNKICLILEIQNQ